MTLNAFNHSDKLHHLLKSTCGAEKWVQKMTKSIPFTSREQLLEKGKKYWFETRESDWLEAFLHHPEIGNIDSLREKYAQGRGQSETEQVGVNEAEASILVELASQNKAYKVRFGFIFIVYATGKSAKQMLDLLNQRINNSKGQEMQIAMQEQWKITKLRLSNLVD